MQLDELLPLFFCMDLDTKPYESEEEYQEDLIRFLDMLLMIACSLKYLEGEGEPPVEIDNAHLRGVPITGKEVIASLQSNTMGKADELPYGEIKEILTRAETLIGSRRALTDIPFRGRLLVDKLALTSFEQFLVLLAWANYEDAKYEILYAYMQGDVRMKLPSFRLGLSLFKLFHQITMEEAISVHRNGKGALSALLEKKELYDNVRLAETFTLSDRVYGWLKGNQSLSTELLKVSELLKDTGDDRNFIPQGECERITSLITLMETSQDKMPQVLNIYGAKGNGRRFLVRQACHTLGKTGLCILVADLLRQDNLEDIIEKIYQEWVLTDCILCFFYTASESSEQDNDREKKLYRLLAMLRNKFSFLIWISEDKAEYLLEEQFHYVCYQRKPLSLKKRYLVWSELAKDYNVSEEVDFQLIANQYLISIRGIEGGLWNADLLRRSENREFITFQDIQNAVKQQTVNQLGSCAVLVPAAYKWEDLILPEEQKKQLEMICNQVKYKSVVGEDWGFYEKTSYGRGVCALFYGAPGTGKTMAVQVLANELGLNLYRIDLSQLISKYVGETEKNISKVFEKAKGINALLFFDEADSVFAKRLDVKDSMDRSANAQTAHLLQEIEDYDGITILATNLAVNIDDAFKRRIKHMIKFAYPSKEIRLKLWTSILPEQVPCEEELDLAFFSEHFELSGSSIKEILISAAFMAASRQSRLCNLDIIEAIKMNYIKYGKTLSNEEFGYLI